MSFIVVDISVVFWGGLTSYQASLIRMERVPRRYTEVETEVSLQAELS